MSDSGLRELRCDACGAALHYEAGAAVIICPHCKTEYVLEATPGELPPGEYTFEVTFGDVEATAAEAKKAKPAGSEDDEEEPPDYEVEALSWLNRGKEIQAIKAVRAQTGWGLKEAKDYVDELAARNGIAIAKGGCATLVVAAFFGLGAAAYLVVALV